MSKEVTSEYIIYGEQSVNIVLPSVFKNDGELSEKEMFDIVSKSFNDAEHLSISVMDVLIEYLYTLKEKVSKKYIEPLEAVTLFVEVARDSAFNKKVMENILFDLEYNSD